jgi:hypothetical protein
MRCSELTDIRNSSEMKPDYFSEIAANKCGVCFARSNKITYISNDLELNQATLLTDNFHGFR